jgi:SAM-dependent methyltransferase
MHRYFARRPFTLFEFLVRRYSKPGDLVLDPFCGGGVTLVEGYLAGRKAAGIDLNPLAAFITQMELGDVDLDRLESRVERVLSEYRQVEWETFSSRCRSCAAPARVLWFEYSAAVACPVCLTSFLISDAVKQGPGAWACPTCAHSFRFSPQGNTPFKVVAVHYTCGACGIDEVAAPTKEDESRAESWADRLEEAKAEGMWLPAKPIPDCNMQRESALFKKGITQFEQLFTDRHLYALGRLKQAILRQPESDREWLLFIFSSSLRYTNRMVTRNPGWRGTRPLEWAKPGFWIPPIQLEANPAEEFRRRALAVIKGKRDYLRRLSARPQQRSIMDLLSADDGFAISPGSATRIPLPDRCVDLILTDPPYGSYVHYADLSNFWSVWLPELPGLGDVIDASEEAVISRKKFPGAKTAQDYQRILEGAFVEAARVLKPGAPLVLTFHNREPRAWLALFVAAARAGFELAPDGVFFQDGIASYKHTAQSRRAGSAVGDFVLTFQARNGTGRLDCEANIRSPLLPRVVAETRRIISQRGQVDPTDLVRDLYLALCGDFMARAEAAVALGASAVEALMEEADGVLLLDSHRRSLLEEYFSYDGNQWSIKTGEVE